MVPLGERWFLVPRLGVAWDFSASLSGTGEAASVNGTLQSGVGKMLDLGMYWGFEGHRGLAVSMRVTLLEYRVGGTRISGSSVGLLATGWVGPTGR
jgi:hypothetical protein